MKTSIEAVVLRDRKDNLGWYFCKNRVSTGAGANPKHNQMRDNLFWVQAIQKDGGHRTDFSNVYRYCKYGRWSIKKIDYYSLAPNFFWFDPDKPDARNESLFAASWKARKGKWEIK